ncbi:DEAD/DEAH box helicase [Arthrobacter halodurans]|uniref:DEAD/DEAH box helicase n=1 Tax=Arthrobacter halodurans TaxID=516699 RepID=A0ABV4UNC4_9MICC
MTASFLSLGVPAELANVLSAQGIESAFPIQEATLPSTLAGKDVLGRGQTGSGKTLAFSLPLVARLVANPKPRRARFPRALIMAPTRELATQISKVVIPLAQSANLRTAVVFGGVSQVRQEKDLNAGVDILIACPGRLEDLLNQRCVDLSQVEISVLDEADHMADLGFLPVVKRILDRAPRGIQHMLFSATLDNGVDKLVQRYLDHPVTHSVDAPQAAVNTMEHHVFVVDADAKKDLVRELASGEGRRIMFMRTKHHAKKMAVWLSKSGVPAVDLHGNLSQNARDRNLEAFSSGKARVLVATDVAARGVHVDGVELVVHIDPPSEHKAYLHRSGRTARAGSDGTVVTVVTPDQQGDVRSLLKAAGLKVPFESVSPDSAAVTAVIGDRAAEVAYVAPQAPAPQRRTASSGDAGAGRGRGRGRQPSAGQGSGRSAERAPRAGAARGSGRSDAARTEGGRADRDVARRQGAPKSAAAGGRSGQKSGGATGGRPSGPRHTSSSQGIAAHRPAGAGPSRGQGNTIADALGQNAAAAAAGAVRSGRSRGSRRATAPQSNQKD